MIKTPCGAEETHVKTCTSTEAKSPVTRQMHVCSHTPQNTPNIQTFPTACIYTHQILHQYYLFRWSVSFPNIICIYVGVFLTQKHSYIPPQQTLLGINNVGQLSLPPTFSTTVALMSFQIYLSPLDLSLYSGQNPYLSWHPPWHLEAPGEAHRAVAPQQSQCHGHPHLSIHTTRLCWNQLSCFSFAFSGGWFLPQTQCENPDHAECDSSSFLSSSSFHDCGSRTADSAGAGTPPCQGPPSLSASFPSLTQMKVPSCPVPTLPCSWVCAPLYIPVTKVKCTSKPALNTYFSTWGSDTSYLFPGLLF